MLNTSNGAKKKELKLKYKERAMSLYDKLRPEHKEKLQKELEVYPTITEMFIKRLKNLDYPIGLQMQDMITLSGIIDMECKPLNFFNYFE